MKTNLVLLFCLITIGSFSQPTIQWSAIQNFPGGGRLAPYSFVIGDVAYAGLGLDSSNHAPNDWYKYDTTSKVWTALAPFPGSGRWGGASFAVNGLGYIVCGAQFGSPGTLAETWMYDPGTDQWTQKMDMPGAPRYLTADFMINTIAYIGTGWSGGTVLKDVYGYDALGDAWFSVADLPGPARGGASGFGIDSFGYIGLGADANAVAFYPDFYKFNPTRNNWTGVDSFPGQLNGVHMLPYEGHGYAISGFHQSSTTNYNVRSVYEYDPSVNKWLVVLDSFPAAGIGYGAGFILDGDMYYGLGSRDGSVSHVQDSLWKTSPFKPNAVYDIQREADLSFYPDPFTRDIYAAASQSADYTVKIYDMLGQTIASGLRIGNSGLLNHDMSELHAGTYIVEASNAKTGQIKRDKLVKE